MKLKICAIVGTRPEVIKLSEVLKTLDKFTDLILVHTGQHYDYELNGVFFAELGVRKPDFFLECASSNGRVISTIANILEKTDMLLESVKPECVLIYGDCNSSLAVYAAKRRHIPIFHMEAGNRCFDARVPEEINRKMIDHLSDVNMTISEHARKYLLNEGCDPNFVFKVGSCMNQVLFQNMENIKSSKILENLYLEPKKYYLVSMHREENIDDISNLNSFSEMLFSLAKNSKVVVSTHPKTKSRLMGIEGFKEKLNKSPNILLEKPFGFFDYMFLQKNALCVISDSGTIFEESDLFSFPAVSIRNSFERPEGLDSGVLSVVSWDKDLISNAIRCAISLSSKEFVKDYHVESVDVKVLNIIFSMVHQVNSKIYYK